MQELKKILTALKGKTVLVLGDLILDKYVYGEVERISPEAPVQIVRMTHEEYKLGGAANVAHNICALGGKAVLIGVVGDDTEATILLEELEKNKISTEGIVREQSRKTTLKTRIISKNHHIIRIDAETIEKIQAETAEALCMNIQECAKKIDSVLLSDYNKGVLVKAVVDTVQSLHIFTAVDPKPANFAIVQGFHLLALNMKEAAAITGIVPKDDASIIMIGEALRARFPHVVITLGERGAAIFSEDIQKIIPTQKKEIFDVTGAGDTFIATLTLALTAKASLEEAGMLANITSGIAVERVGTVAPTAQEVLHMLQTSDWNKIKTLSALKTIVEEAKRQQRIVVTTNGTFDLLHMAHIRLLQKAKKEGDILIVMMNSDASVKRFKGEQRPIIPEEERAEMLASLACVDYVTIMEEDTPLPLFATLQPHIHVKGGSFILARLQDEQELLESFGGTLKVFELEEGHSTTNLYQKVLATFTQGSAEKACKEEERQKDGIKVFYREP